MKLRPTLLQLAESAFSVAFRLPAAGLNRLLIALSFTAVLVFLHYDAEAQSQLNFASQNVSSEAVNLFNQGTSLLRSNRNDEAAAKFERACSISPNFAEAHHEWAIALLKLDKSNEAIEQFNQAISIDPGLAASWLSLGGAYQSSGRVNEAIGAYTSFLSKFPQDDDVPRVRNLIVMLQREQYQTGDTASVSGIASTVPPLAPPLREDSNRPLNQPGRSGQADGDDYLSIVTQKGVIRWPAKRMPLRVFIEKGELIPGFRPEFGTILKDAFLEWAEASGGPVRFVFVDVPVTADIVCRWSANTVKFKNSAESAETKLYSDRAGVAKGEIEILTMATSASLPLTNNRMRGTCLHEVGHALGLAGHTRNPEDIMFFSSSPSDSWKDLSPRDKKTLIRLYEEK